MGSPLGPVSADIFMAKLENSGVSDCIKKTHLYVRYFDDTFVVCNKTLSNRQILNSFNNCHLSMKFTKEEEQNESLPFLDALVIRNINGKSTTRLYRKPTWNG